MKSNIFGKYQAKSIKMLYRFFLSILSVFIFLSCSQDYISAPTSAAALSKTVSAPSSLKASQGKKGLIELKWDSVANAKRYAVYYAPNQFENFTKIYVTPEVTSSSMQNIASISVASGTSAWYRVTAIDAYGKESDYSLMVQGTSLACPLISTISEISDSESTIYWFMGNVSESTYLNDLKYIVTCINPDGSKKEILSCSGDAESVTFTNLKPHTSYSYTVEAYLISDQSNSEISDPLDAETARRLRPEAPVELYASRGLFADKIQLTWLLPEKVQVEAENGYELHDVYFRIYRRISGESDWVELDSYFGANSSSLDTAHPFVSTEETVNEETGIKYEALSTLDFYQENTKVLWTDDLEGLSDSEKKELIEYKVQSFSDKTAKTVTSNESAATTDGFLMGKVSFTTSNYSTNFDEANEKIISSSVKLNLEWDNRDATESYIYVVKESYYKFAIDNLDSSSNPSEDTQGSHSFIKSDGLEKIYFEDISSLNSFTRTFTLPSERGYYSYQLYILDKNFSDSPEKAIEDGNFLVKSSSLAGNLTVTDSSLEISAEVFQGYSDRFVIKFKYEDEYTYSVSHVDEESGNEEIDLTFTPSESASGESEKSSYSLNESQKEVTFIDFAEPGQTRSFIIRAEKDGTAPASWTSQESYKTLGKPKPVFDTSTLSYTDITFSWESVNLASSYIIQLDDREEITLESDGSPSYTYTFENVEIDSSENSLSASTSGSSHTVYITAVTEEDNEKNIIGGQTSKGSTEGYTAGLCKINAHSEQGKEVYWISSYWTLQEDIERYQLIRQRSELENSSWTRKNAENFFITTDGSEASILTQTGDSLEINSMIVYIEDGKLYLKDCDPYNMSKISSSYSDTYIEPDTSDAFKKSQSRIEWGIPYTYILIPLLNENDSARLEDENLILETSEGKSIKYTDAFSVSSTGSTVGYGLGLEASKADSTTSINLKWTPPYSVQSSSYPAYYEKLQGDDWPKDGVAIETGATSKNRQLIDDENADITDVYEYVIQYRRIGSNDKRSISPSLLFEMEQMTDSNSEKLNSGYIFSFGTFKAVNIKTDGKEGFTEELSWNLWDYSKRKRGPSSSIVIECQNKNNSSSYFPVAEISADGSWGKYGNETDGAQDWYNCLFSSSPTNNWMDITPYQGKSGSGNKVMTENGDYHDGLLKVQRDMMHNYKIHASRTNSSGEEITWERKGSTYRKISGQEFAKCVLLIVSDVSYQAGSKTNTISGSEGTYSSKIESSTWAWDPYNLTTTFNSYVHLFKTCPGYEGNLSSFFVLNGGSSEQGKCYNDNTYKIGKTTLSVSGKNTASGLSSYSGTLSFSAGEENKSTVWTLNVEYQNGNSENYSVSVSKNETEFKKWFPFQLGSSLDISYSGEYNESYPFFDPASYWWEVR